MTPDQFFLASAYLDGELTADERRIAEADPAVMAEVEELRALQADLADVSEMAPPEATARESAIAAAMAEFSLITPVAAPTIPPAANVVPFRPRPKYATYLGIAAAVVGVGLLGTVIVNSGFGGSDEQSAEAPAADASAALDGDRATERVAIDATEAPSEAATADLAPEMVGDAPQAEIAVGGDAPEATVATLDVATPDSAPSDPALPTDDTLIEYALTLLEKIENESLGSTPNTECFVDDEFDTPVLDLAALPTEVGSIDLFIAIDQTNRLAYGLDPDGCAVLVDAPLP